MTQLDVGYGLLCLKKDYAALNLLQAASLSFLGAAILRRRGR
jgi:hypothetical protein